MELNSYFSDFLANIRPTDEQRDAAKNGHATLREHLMNDESLSTSIVSTFLQGSYRRATAVRATGDKNLDVDVVVVTRFKEEEWTAEQAIGAFEPFVKKHYGEDAYELQGRSIGIKLADVDLDLVITSAPSEEQEGILKTLSVQESDTVEEVSDWGLVKSIVEAQFGGYDASLHRSLSMRDLLEKAVKSDQESQWKLEPLRIPDRNQKVWQPTHPLEQMKWTWEKNATCNSHYVNIVKAIKWWRSTKEPLPTYPKGYPIEHLIGQMCPNDVTGVADGVTRSLEAIVSTYQLHVALESDIHLSDHGVEQNVFGRVSKEDFAGFYAKICSAASRARTALDEKDTAESARLWRELFGDQFPEYKGGTGGSGGAKGGFTERSGCSSPSSGRFGTERRFG